MTTSRLAKSVGPIAPDIGKMTPLERVEWANSNNAEVNAQRRIEGLGPIRWVWRDDHLAIESAGGSK